MKLSEGCDPNSEEVQHLSLEAGQAPLVPNVPKVISRDWIRGESGNDETLPKFIAIVSSLALGVVAILWACGVQS